MWTRVLTRDQRLAAEPRLYCRGHVARLGLLQAHVRAGRLHTVIQRQWHHGSTRGIRLREGGAAPRVTPDPNLRVYASGNAAAEVSQVCWNANERGVYGRCRQQNSAQLWYVGGAGKAICCFSHDFRDDIFTDNWLSIQRIQKQHLCGKDIQLESVHHIHFTGLLESV